MESPSRCPMTWGMFLGTAALMTIYKRSQHQNNKKQGGVESSNNNNNNKQLLLLPASCEVVFVLGAPGTGKGTQCQLLESRLTTTTTTTDNNNTSPWTHLSAGDLLRAERDAGTGALADLIRAKIQAGAIVPSSITVQLLETAMKGAFELNGSTKFLIDGFPRSHENMQAWEDAMKSHTVKFVLNFECPEEVLVGRLLERAKDSGRSDDNIDVIRKRFQTHVESTVPILAYFETNATPLHTIDSAKSIEQVYETVVALFDNEIGSSLEANRPAGSAAPAGIIVGSNPRKYLIGGNWKCNGTWNENLERVTMFNNAGNIPANVEVALCVPELNIPMLLSGLRKDIAVGAQNCGVNKGDGAFTGEVGSHQLKDMGCVWVIIGHSERREGFGGAAGETEDLCAQKCKVAIDNGLKVMFAIGEKKEERESGVTMTVCAKQLEPLAKILKSSSNSSSSPEDYWDKIAIAYEPVWAIGTGLTATPEMAQETHLNIRNWIKDNVSPNVAAAVRIQYGGSMKGANAKELLAQPDIDGGLIGGASLKADFFNVIHGIPK